MNLITREPKYDFMDLHNIICDFVEMPAIYSSLHSHNFFQIEYIIQGSGIYMIDGKVFSVKPGMLFFISPANTHYVNGKDFKYFRISFTETASNIHILHRLCYEKSTLAFEIKKEERDFVVALISELSRSLDNKNYSRILLETLLTKLSDTFFHISTNYTSNPSMKKAIIYTIQCFNQKISLTDVAAHVNLTPKYFSMLFKNDVGMSFKEYLDDLRFSYARKLLLYSDISIKQVGYESGFSNYENFIRRFSERFKISPNKYRQTHVSIHGQEE